MPQDTISINLKQISPEQTHALYCFFRDSRLQKWDKNTLYHFADGSPFTLNQSVFQRQRKARNGLVPDGFRYQVIDENKRIGVGNFAEVYSVGTLAFKANGASRYYTEGSDGIERVVKVQRLEVKNESNDLALESTPLTEKKLKDEILYSSRTDHLHIKPATILFEANAQGEPEKTSYTVMDRLPGIDLFDALEKIHLLSSKEKVALCLQLLIKLKEQVHQKAIIHRDIKPDNIRFLYQSGKPMLINIYDYGLAVDSNAPSKDLIDPVGTLYYVAPELIRGECASFKSDVFSMGRVLSLIWKVQTENFMLYDPNFPRNLLFGLFDGISDLNSNDKTEIKELFKKMLHIDPRQRCSLDEAIAVFSSLSIRMGNSVTMAQSPHVLFKKPKLYIEPTFANHLSEKQDNDHGRTNT